jgi:hypothetical protein
MWLQIIKSDLIQVGVAQFKPDTGCSKIENPGRYISHLHVQCLCVSFWFTWLQEDVTHHACLVCLCRFWCVVSCKYCSWASTAHRLCTHLSRPKISHEKHKWLVTLCTTSNDQFSQCSCLQFLSVLCGPALHFGNVPVPWGSLGLFILEGLGNLMVPLLFGWDHGKTHGPWLKGLCSGCNLNLDQKNGLCAFF